MTFTLLSEARHFVLEYERRRSYRWRQGESLKAKDGVEVGVALEARSRGCQLGSDWGGMSECV
jgi:hypothetical protein